MIDFQDWKNHERIEFRNQDLQKITIPEYRIKLGLSFDTELHFENCNIESINATCLYLGKKITIENCVINELGFFATYFFGGFEMRNCKVKDWASFEAGVHNLFPNEFIIDSCTFDCYVDFFDVYFEGTTRIINNKFLGGSNIGIYGKETAAFKGKGAEYIFENNEGNIKLVTEDDPFYGSKRDKTSH